MRNNQPVTGHEYKLSPTDYLISRTDLKGRITFANRAFIDASGYAAEELLGAAHNLVRHPDMPPEAFADLWLTIQAGRSWTGMVKNRRKNGDFYWVQANVTPIHRNGVTEGYMSVRREPDRAEVDQAGRIYRRILDGQASGLRILQGEVVSRGISDPIGSLRRIPIRRRISVVATGAAMLSLGLGAVAWSAVAPLAAASSAPGW